MLDVHPPHHAVNGWRDFFIHIATITIGLLIALALEGAVEALHHRHIVREARANIRRELERNEAEAKNDIGYVRTMQGRMQGNLEMAQAMRAHPEVKTAHSLLFNAEWNGFSSAGWRTARDMGALSYMDSEEVERYSEMYEQQELVGRQGTDLFLHQSELGAPMMMERSDAVARPEELAEVVHGIAVTQVRLDVLRELLEQLVKQYGSLLRA